MGPLDGLRIVEFEAIGPVPFCAMLLADLGADVIRIDRIGGATDPLRRLLGRGRRTLQLDLKRPEGVEAALRVVASADIVLEGRRPGVMERLGVGPADCLARNPALIYGRMTGWGQDGPLAKAAGHDINYIALTGALHSMGSAGDPPPPPLNLVGDFGGGSLYLAMGVLAALHERATSGRGQVVDAAMVDGAASLMSMAYEMRSLGMWGDARSANLLDGGAPFYRCYQTSDGGFVAVGALEPQFYDALIAGLGLDPDDLPAQLDRSRWPELEAIFAARFAEATRDEWDATFAGTDACVAPVLSMEEAPHHAHMAARGTFITSNRAATPGPAPRFGRTPSGRVDARRESHRSDADTILAEAGFDRDEVAAMRRANVVA